MSEISTAQWHVFFLICLVVLLGLTVATVVICRVLIRAVRTESLRIERQWKRQREHDQEIMLADTERLIRATAARRSVLTDALDGLLPNEPSDPLDER